jgi:hypothetical protein
MYPPSAELRIRALSLHEAFEPCTTIFMGEFDSETENVDWKVKVEHN